MAYWHTHIHIYIFWDKYIWEKLSLVLHATVLFIVYNHYNQSRSLSLVDFCSSLLSIYTCAKYDKNYIWLFIFKYLHWVLFISIPLPIKMIDQNKAPFSLNYDLSVHQRWSLQGLDKEKGRENMTDQGKKTENKLINVIW